MIKREQKFIDKIKAASGNIALMMIARCWAPEVLMVYAEEFGLAVIDSEYPIEYKYRLIKHFGDGVRRK